LPNLIEIFLFDFMTASRKKILFSISLIYLLFYSQTCFTQITEAGELITTEQGLSQGFIHDIIQDEEGFMWFATRDGLNRYNGYTFKIFTNDPQDPKSISSNNVTKLFIDSSGRLWAMTSNAGINIYNKDLGKFHHIYHNPKDANSLSGNSVGSIVEIKKDEFLVVVDNNVINKLIINDSFFIEHKNLPVDPIELPKEGELDQAKLGSNLNTVIRGIVKDTKGRIWVGGKNDIYQLHIKEKRFSIAAENYTFEFGVALKNGSILLGGPSSTLLFDGGEVHQLKPEYGDARDISIDPKGSVSIVNYTYFIETSQDSLLHNQSKFRHISILAKISVFKDKSGIFWIGTNGYGIIKYNPSKLKFGHQLIGKSISDIYQLPGSEVCYTDNLGDVYNLENIHIDFTRFGIPGDISIVDILKKESGEIVISGESGIKRDKSIFFFNTYNEKSHQVATPGHLVNRKMAEGKNGDIWFQVQEGILTRIDSSRSKIETINLLSGKPITDEDLSKLKLNFVGGTTMHYYNNVLWLGYESGIYKCEFDPLSNNIVKIKIYKNIIGDNSSLSNNFVTNFMNDPLSPERFIWVSTRGGGINKFDIKEEKFERFTTKNGLPNNVVYGTLSDQSSNIWGSTNKGLFCLSPKERTFGNITYNIKNFNKSDGLQESEFNTNAFKTLSDGKLAFGGVNGINIFDPQQILIEEYMPPVFITKLMVDNNEITPLDNTNLLKKDILFTKGIELTHLQDILTIEFASLDFNSPEKNKYRYQLKELDKDWIESGNKRSATYLHLPTNTYTFELQGSNSHGIWNDKTTKLKITVLPPWWLTWWAYLVYALFFVFLLWRYYEFISKRAKLNQQLIFEKSEAIKAKELDQLKTKLYTNLTHEFRTPLTIIIGMVDQIRGATNNNLNEGLDMIKRNGENLLQLINKMLDLSKIEGGKMVLDARQGNIIQTLKNVSDSFVRYASNKGIELHFLSELDHKDMIYDDEKIRHILSNLISNALKFTSDGGHVYISIREQENKLILKVKDTGKGIATEHQKRIFDRFYQVEDGHNRSSEGTGIGLALCKELVMLMDGTISLQSPPPGSSKGSEFTVILPTADVLGEGLQPDIPKQEYNKRTSQQLKQQPIESLKKMHIKANTIITTNQEDKVILLVEDNADIVAYIATCLQEYKLIVATNGAEGLEMAIENIPDLIVSDVMMPIMDGFEMCEKIKQDNRTNHIPVVMLTAKADLESKLEGLEFGANAYISKPFDKNELILTVRNLFDLRTELQNLYRIGINDETVFESKDIIGKKDSSEQDEFVIKVRERIENRVADLGLNVEQLAQELHFSQSQFNRKLNALIGITPVRFIRQIRLEKAKTMLLDTDLTITVIAFDCGFNDPSYFSRVFKKEFGVSPVDWREKT
jgi:signal transduction histidine kinase/CheY-like chemotaxis protein/AraC-like DNA-binding protein/ligand-binding sensor domain-containing protein